MISWRQDTGIRDSSTGLKVPNNLDFKRNFGVFQPVVGLQDDADIVYFTTKIHCGDDKAWVAAVDMSNKELLGVATFPGKARSEGINDDFIIVHSRISNHLRTETSAACSNPES